MCRLIKRDCKYVGVLRITVTISYGDVGHLCGCVPGSSRVGLGEQWEGRGELTSDGSSDQTRHQTRHSHVAGNGPAETAAKWAAGVTAATAAGVGRSPPPLPGRQFMNTSWGRQVGHFWRTFRLSNPGRMTAIYRWLVWQSKQTDGVDVWHNKLPAIVDIITIHLRYDELWLDR